MVDVTVTVLMCTNEGDDRLFKTIDSIIEQTCTNWELIVVCNGKKRSLIADLIEKRYLIDNIIVLQTAISNLPFSLNLGLHQAKGKYIARIDTGDIAVKNRIQLQTDYLNTRDNIELVGSNYILIDEHGLEISTSSLPITTKSIEKFMPISNPICHPSVMFRKSTVLNLGGYRSQTASEDFDLWIRISQIGRGKIANIQDPLIYYENVSPNNTRKNPLAYCSISYSFFEAFLITRRLSYLMGCVVSFAKFLFYWFRQVLQK